MLRSGADCADAVQDALLRACAVPAAALMPRVSLPFWGSNVSMREDFPCHVRNDLAEIAVGDCHARIDEAVHDSMALYPQGIDSVEHFKRELIDCLDDCNNWRIKAKIKGLHPALHRLQALAASFNSLV